MMIVVMLSIDSVKNGEQPSYNHNTRL